MAVKFWEWEYILPPLASKQQAHIEASLYVQGPADVPPGRVDRVRPLHRPGSRSGRTQDHPQLLCPHWQRRPRRSAPPSHLWKAAHIAGAPCPALAKLTDAGLRQGGRWWACRFHLGLAWLGSAINLMGFAGDAARRPLPGKDPMWICHLPLLKNCHEQCCSHTDLHNSRAQHPAFPPWRLNLVSIVCTQHPA